MKKALLFMALAMLCAFSACGNEDDAPPLTASATQAATTGVAAATQQPTTSVATEPNIYQQFVAQNIGQLAPGDMSALDAEPLDDYRIFLVGEDHYVPENIDIQIALLEYLNERFGLRYVLLEAGFSIGLAMNRVMETGDMALLERIAGSAGETRYEYFYAYHLAQYELNQRLPDDRKLMFIGVDIDHTADFGAQLMCDLLQNGKAMPLVVADAFEALSAERLSVSLILSAYEAFTQHEQVFRDYLGEDYRDFYYGIRSMAQLAQYFQAGQLISVREAFICQNLNDLLAEYEIDRCYGDFGRDHSFQNYRFDYQKTMANYLNTEHEWAAGKVLSFLSIYDNCFSFDYRDGHVVAADNAAIAGPTLLNAFSEVTQGCYSLCTTEGLPLGGGISENGQYLLYIRGSGEE